MRKPIIAGNWKMHKTVAEGVAFIQAVKDEVAGTDVEALVCAPFTLLPSLVEADTASASTYHNDAQPLFAFRFHAPRRLFFLCESICG